MVDLDYTAISPAKITTKGFRAGFEDRTGNVLQFVGFPIFGFHFVPLDRDCDLDRDCELVVNIYNFLGTMGCGTK